MYMGKFCKLARQARYAAYHGSTLSCSQIISSPRCLAGLSRDQTGQCTVFQIYFCRLQMKPQQPIGIGAQISAI